jgi:predicted metalloprotease with PDZ domain
MHENRAYMRVYWSGTAFFLEADLALRRASHNRQSLDAVLQEFASCCVGTVAPNSGLALVRALDSAAGSDLFTTLYHSYKSTRGMPDYHRMLSQLGITRTKRNVRLLPVDAVTEAIRGEIMRPSTPAQRAAAAAARSTYPG